MNVLILSQYYWPENFRINEIVRGLNDNGVQVEVLTGKPNYPQGRVFAGYRPWGCVREEHYGTPVHRVPIVPRGSRAMGLVANYLSFVISAYFFGWWMLRGRRFDAILVFAPSPILQAIPGIGLGWIKRCPTILWVQDLWPESLVATGHLKHPTLVKVVRCFVKWIYRRVDLLLVQSRGFVQKVEALSGSTPVAYYPNSFIDGVSNSGSKSICIPGMDCDFPVVFAGNMGSAQAVDVVLEAAIKLQDLENVRFVMVGDGSKRNWLMGQAASRQLTNMAFPGQYPVEAMSGLMSKAGALLVTLADTEIFRLTIPSKIQAYLAAGRPIIACMNGAGAEIIEEAGAGVVVPAEDALALANAVRHLSNLTDAERDEMGGRGRKYYEEHFAHDKLVEHLIAHFERAIETYNKG